MKVAVAIAFLALNFYTYNYLATDPVIPPRSPFESFPMELGDWACAKPEKMTPEVERNLGVTDYFICDYRRRAPKDVVNVYVGYHETQVREEGGGSGENAIHPPAHCLPGSGWDIIQADTVPLGDWAGLPEKPGSARRVVIAKGDARQLVYYWYQSRGRVISVDWQKIIYVGLDRALRSRTDGSLVRFSTPIRRGSEVEEAEATLRDLAPRVIAKLPAYVPE